MFFLLVAAKKSTIVSLKRHYSAFSTKTLNTTVRENQKHVIARHAQNDVSWRGPSYALENGRLWFLVQWRRSQWRHEVLPIAKPLRTSLLGQDELLGKSRTLFVEAKVNKTLLEAELGMLCTACILKNKRSTPFIRLTDRARGKKLSANGSKGNAL